MVAPMKLLIRCLFLFLCVGRLHAAALHAVYVGDTTDSIIGETTKADLRNVGALMEAVAAITGLEYKPVVFADSRFRRELVEKQLAEMRAGSDDVVLFYYSGHGMRSESKAGPWPDLWYRIDDAQVDFEGVAVRVSRMQPRLGLVISDCCNNVVKSRLTRAAAPSALDQRAVDNLVRLFMKSQGIWVATGAGIGEYAYADDRGGYFTNALLQSINYGLLYAPNLLWDEVFEVTAWTLEGVQTPTWKRYSVRNAL
jgi:hypothetical protein